MPTNDEILAAIRENRRITHDPTLIEHQEWVRKLEEAGKRKEQEGLDRHDEWLKEQDDRWGPRSSLFFAR